MAGGELSPAKTFPLPCRTIEPHATGSFILPTAFPFAKTVADPLARTEPCGAYISGGHMCTCHPSPFLWTPLLFANTSVLADLFGLGG